MFYYIYLKTIIFIIIKILFKFYNNSNNNGKKILFFIIEIVDDYFYFSYRNLIRFSLSNNTFTWLLSNFRTSGGRFW